MSWRDKPNIKDVHEPVLEAHNKYLDEKFAEGNLVLTGGAVGPDGVTRVGSDSMAA